MRGRSALDFRSDSTSETEEEEEVVDGCEFSLSWFAVGWVPLVVPLELLSFGAGEGIVWTGSEELYRPVSAAIMRYLGRPSKVYCV